jgi:putative sterol carrier protein
MLKRKLFFSAANSRSRIMTDLKSQMEETVEGLNASPKAKHLMEAFARRISISDTRLQFSFEIEEGAASLGKRSQDDCDLAIVIHDTDSFGLVLGGTLDITHPVARGQLVVEHGKLSDLILLSRILVASQKGKKK